MPESAPASQNSGRREQPYYETNMDLDAAVPSMQWQLGEMLSHIAFEDFRPQELADVLTMLAPIHSRVLLAADAAAGQSGNRRLLRLVR